MKGRINVRVRNNRNEYEFTLNRNITILCGYSGTGKSTLYKMVRDFSNQGKASGVKASLTGDTDICVLEGKFWYDDIEKIHDSVVLIDEDSDFIITEEFARAVKRSSNYFLIITRDYLQQLPYSVDEIYQIKGHGRKKQFQRVYNDVDRLYIEEQLPVLPFQPEMIIVEDSNSGMDFYRRICSDEDIEVVSAGGKDNIINVVKRNLDKRILVTADGAAFGPEITDLAEVQKNREGSGLIALFLPESFEWMILKSGVICKSDIPELTDTSAYVESAEYVSWERYFTALLIELSGKKEYGHYSKKHLDPYYLLPSSVAKIKDIMKHVEL